MHRKYANKRSYIALAEVVEKPSDAPVESPSAAEEHTEHKNTVRQLVEEVCNLMGDSHNIREEIRARGVQFHTLNAMIELGVQDKPQEQNDVINTAVAASKKAYGSAAITQEQLREYLGTLVMLEKDIGHVRRLAQLQNINMLAMNFLTQMIRSNPGDGGEKAVNDFIAYAALCDIKLEKFKDIAQEIGGSQKTVLPQIELETESERVAARKRLLADVIVGLAIGLSVFWVFF